jgi:hypothetical protein
MRFDDEHAYDQRINDIATIHDHLLPEYKFKRFVTNIVKKHGSLTGMYWLIDFISALYPDEFSENRKIALKQLTQKIYITYDDNTSHRYLVSILKAKGMGPSEIARTLNISRNSVYYFMKRNEDLPTRCILTYGEYNLMLDFLDCWNNFKGLDDI